jgi:hypothetical protein
MNSIMERWIHSCRHELLDRMLIWNQARQLHALREFERHHNQHRPHRGIAKARPPRALPDPTTEPAALAPPVHPPTQPTRRTHPRIRACLSAGRYSFPLRQAEVHESVTGTLREARDGLDRILGTRIGTRQLMQIATGVARDVCDFYPQHPVPGLAVRPDGQAGPRDLLVLSIDATGVNMIDSRVAGQPTGP